MAIRIPKSAPKSLSTSRQKGVHIELGKGYIQYSDIASDPRSQQRINRRFVLKQQNDFKNLCGEFHQFYLELK